MVGVDSEKEGAVRKWAVYLMQCKYLCSFGSNLFEKRVRFGRNGYGWRKFLHTHFHRFLANRRIRRDGLRRGGKTRLQKELEAIEDDKEREELFNKLVQKMYDAGRASRGSYAIGDRCCYRPS